MSEPVERITHVMMTWGDHVTETGYNLGIDFSWEASHTPPIPHFVDHLDYGVNYKLGMIMTLFGVMRYIVGPRSKEARDRVSSPVCLWERLGLA